MDIKMSKKVLGIIILGVLVIGAGVLGIQAQNTYALQQKTIEEFMAPIGFFMKEHPEFLAQSAASLQTNEADPDEIIARVNGWPITLGELEFRKGLREKSGLGSADYSDVFNTLIEEKVVLSYAFKNNILPTTEQVAAFIEQEKEYYQEPNSQYQENVDAILSTSNMTIDEYWNSYEWYNVFRLLALDNSYKHAVKQGQELGKLPIPKNGIDQEMLSQFEDYWINVKKELKAKASVEIVDDQGLDLNPELNKIFM